MKDRTDFAWLLREQHRLLARLVNWPPVLRGSLREHANRCGNPNCRCRAVTPPVLHGPYHYLSHRYQNRTQTILLTKRKLPYARAWVRNYQRLFALIYDLCEVNFRLLRYHHAKLSRQPKRRQRSP